MKSVSVADWVVGDLGTWGLGTGDCGLGTVDWGPGDLRIREFVFSF